MGASVSQTCHGGPNGTLVVNGVSIPRKIHAGQRISVQNRQLFINGQRRRDYEPVTMDATRDTKWIAKIVCLITIGCIGGYVVLERISAAYT